MKRYSNRGWKIGVVVWILIVSCNLPMAVTPVATEPGLSSEEIAATAVELTLSARAGATSTNTPPSAEVTLAPTATNTEVFTVTPCFPITTANAVDVNVRAGPATVYDIVGALPSGTSARVFGQNDSRTWWYIEFPASSGRYAWVAGSVTTASCIPNGLQYVNAPPLPTLPPATATDIPPVVLAPDLYVSEYSWSPVPPHMGVPFHIRVGVYNQGNAPAGAFTVRWWLAQSGVPNCTWNVASLAAHGGRILECNYTPGGWNNAYASLVFVDVADTVDESNEGNNTRSATLQVAP